MPGYAVIADPWWVPALFVLAVGHVTNVCNTLYLHRGVTHGGVEFHPVAEHFMRFWLWLTTGIVTREWVAVHRKHHAHADKEGDPHSPEVEGLWAILLRGVFFYQDAKDDEEMLDKYGRGCPDDWVERNVYSRHSTAGLLLVLLLDVWLFGAAVGLGVWSIMAIWMPIMGNIINGLGHAMGYRNFGTKDESRNIYPWGMWIVGEELHNNHHADPRSAKFKAHWWEFDVGWFYIRLLSLVQLAEIVYARTVSAKEFAAKHYREKVQEPVERARADARERVEQATEGARERVERATEGAREKLQQARESVDEARAGLDAPDGLEGA